MARCGQVTLRVTKQLVNDLGGGLPIARRVPVHEFDEKSLGTLLDDVHSSIPLVASSSSDSRPSHPLRLGLSVVYERSCRIEIQRNGSLGHPHRVAGRLESPCNRAFEVSAAAD
jgi:hypothetical protein